jgi:peptidoglycan hydrolase-like amidase
MRIHNVRLSCLIICLLFIVYCLFPNFVYAQGCVAPSGSDNLLSLSEKITQCQQDWDQMEAAKQPHVTALKKMEADIAAFQARIKTIEVEVAKKAVAITAGEKELSGLMGVASWRIREFYMRNTLNNPIALFLTSTNIGTALRIMAYQQAVISTDKKVITQTAVSVKELEDKKKALESEKTSLAYLKEETDRRAESVRKLVTDAEAYQSKLSGIIANLTALQESILSAKVGTFQTSVGDVPLADDPASRPDYNPGFSPAFAAFSFGAPHFKGMSQYGAFGRAKSGQGQNYETILKAYYGNVRIEEVDTNFSLPTTVGSLPFEDNYLKGIAEMPTSWADQGGYEALKAQAIAARSYALAYTGWRMGDRSAKNAICVTENCQVYNSSKAGNPGRWGDAVNDTKRKILVSNNSGEVVNAWYASTSGGYQESYSSLGHTTPAFWDTQSGRSGWTSQAYEKVAGSPWFYKGWYKNRSGDSCGRSHPWLTSEEMADILNGWSVLYQGGGDSSRVTPLGSCWGGNPYSMSELRSIAGFTSVSGASVTYSDAGVTASVTFQTNKGSITINGNDFYKAFNLRAPARIALRSGLFNIEKK